MYVIIMQRTDVPHIYNYDLSNGQVRTLCGKNISKNPTDSVVSCDAIFPGICRNCLVDANDMYLDDLQFDPRWARNSWQSRLSSLRDYHAQEILGPSGLAYGMEHRVSNKINRARKAVKRKK